MRHRAFHPNGEQKILTPAKDVFAVLRTAPGGGEHILTLTNVTDRAARLQLPLSEVGVNEVQWYDLYGKRGWMAKAQKLDLTLQPYDVMWLIPFRELERSIES